MFLHKQFLFINVFLTLMITYEESPNQLWFHIVESSFLFNTEVDDDQRHSLDTSWTFL